MSAPTEREVAIAKELLARAGFVVLREKSYRQAQTRQAIAESRADWETSRRADTDRWAREALAEGDRLRDRLTFVYGEARARGASVEDLAGEPPSLLELLGDVRVRFWACLIPGHDKNGGYPTVRWAGGVARCLTPGCIRTSNDPQPEATS